MRWMLCKQGWMQKTLPPEHRFVYCMRKPYLVKLLYTCIQHSHSFGCYFGMLFIGMALAITLFSYAFYQEDAKAERERILTRDLHHIEIQQTLLTDALAKAFHMVSFISDQVNLHRPFSNPEGKRQLDADIISLLKNLPGFNKVQLLDLQGHELIRISHSKAGSLLTPKDKLQNQRDDYFHKAMYLKRGHIYISPLNLNIEHGEVEQPPNPVIRLAIPAFEGEQRTGTVMLNMKMDNVLTRLQQVNHTGESTSYLLNSDGFFLSSPHSEWNWGFILHGQRHQNFAAKFPEAWHRISGQHRGHFEADGDMFSFATFDPLKPLEQSPAFMAGDNIKHHRYIIVSRLSAAAFAQIMAQQCRQYLIGFVLLMLAAALLAGILARTHTQKANTRKALDDSRKMLAHLISSTPVVHYACRIEGNRCIPTFFSPNIKSLSGFEPDAIIGDAEWWKSRLNPEDRDRIESFWKAINENRDKYVHEYRFKHADGEFRWLHDELAIVRDADGKAVEVIGSWLDITEHRQDEKAIESALREKEVLLREIHHRVKNNMQIISSMLKLQASHAKDRQLQNMYRDSQSRINAMSMVHEQLYASATLSAIRAHAYLENIVFSVVRSYCVSAQHLAVDVDAGEILLHMDQAIPCGLIVNELVSNAAKYAFTETGGAINVSLTRVNDKYLRLKVSDNGCGLPADLNIRETTTLGLQLVDTLSDQIDGKLTVNCEQGTEICILFPATEEDAI